MPNTLDIVQLCAEAADSKKALDIVILDLRKLTYITDYFVICSGSSTTQINAIADAIAQTLAKAGVHPSHLEGQAESSWLLMDYGDVVVHIFDEQSRVYYSLEKLWSDAARVPFGIASKILKNASS